MEVLAIANQKGGCGKTTTSVNLAVALAQAGKRVLMIDLDPQGHATLGLGSDIETLEKTVYDALVNHHIGLSDVLVSTKTEHLKVAPSNVLLSGAELELAGTVGRELVLKEQIKALENEYDICVIDCPPSLGMLTLNALIASTGVIVPVQVHYYAMEGLKQLFETLNIIKEYPYPSHIRVLGLLLTFVEKRTLFSRQIQQEMREFFGGLVFDTVIHKTIRLAEAPSAGESVLTYAPGCNGAHEYRDVAQEVINRLSAPPQMQQSGIMAEEVGNVQA